MHMCRTSGERKGKGLGVKEGFLKEVNPER